MKPINIFLVLMAVLMLSSMAYAVPPFDPPPDWAGSPATTQILDCLKFGIGCGDENITWWWEHYIHYSITEQTDIINSQLFNLTLELTEQHQNLTQISNQLVELSETLSNQHINITASVDNITLDDSELLALTACFRDGNCTGWYIEDNGGTSDDLPAWLTIGTIWGAVIFAALLRS